jgi:hypothetical protein
MEKIGLGGGIIFLVVGIVLTKAGTWQYGIPCIIGGLIFTVSAAANFFGI